MTLLLLGCFQPRQPPKLFAEVREPAAFSPIVSGNPAADDIERPVGLVKGAPAPADGILAPPVEWARLKSSDERRVSLERELDRTEDDLVTTRAFANHAYATCAIDLRASEAERKGLRAGLPVAAALFFLLGAGSTVGVAWALPK